MIQCGDPEGGSKEPDPGFKDELVGRLHHEGRGVLSMICGPNTNKTQVLTIIIACIKLGIWKMEQLQTKCKARSYKT